MLPERLQPGQQVCVTPTTGGRLILTHRTGLAGVGAWVRDAAEKRGADYFLVELVEADGTVRELGIVRPHEVDGWP